MTLTLVVMALLPALAWSANLRFDSASCTVYGNGLKFDMSALANHEMTGMADSGYAYYLNMCGTTQHTCPSASMQSGMMYVARTRIPHPLARIRPHVILY